MYKANAVFANDGVAQSGEAHEPCQDVIRGLGTLDAKGRLTVVVMRRGRFWLGRRLAAWYLGVTCGDFGSLEFKINSGDECDSKSNSNEPLRAGRTMSVKEEASLYR